MAASVRDCDKIKPHIELRLRSVEILIHFLSINLLCLRLFTMNAGSVMHYPLGKEMKTKKSSTGIRIGQRNGLSGV